MKQVNGPKLFFKLFPGWKGWLIIAAAMMAILLMYVTSMNWSYTRTIQVTVNGTAETGQQHIPYVIDSENTLYLLAKPSFQKAIITGDEVTVRYRTVGDLTIITGLVSQPSQAK